MSVHLGFVTGATPDKWARTWRERSREGLALVPLEEETQLDALRAGDLDMALVRLPIEREGLHCIPLYAERAVVVVGAEHAVTATSNEEGVTLADPVDEQLVLPHASGWTPDVDQLDWPTMSVGDAVEVVASGTGIVILPMSVARLHARKDVAWRPVSDLAETTIGLAWLLDNDDARVQAFIGIVRGRSERSSR